MVAMTVEARVAVPLKLRVMAELVEISSVTAILHLGVVVTKVATALIDLHERV
tara:strand:- start:484 stop:642 length:159 start_codon:yes stop_codon:yes gene_type:complete